jgi:CheY-like chemotaxis protein
MMPGQTLTAGPAPAAARRQSILFVEDDRRLCSFLCRYFGSEGYGTEAVHDGAEMWRALRRGARDLVVLDLGLPGTEDGYSLARALKTQGDVGILILSARPRRRTPRRSPAAASGSTGGSWTSMPGRCATPAAGRSG